MNQKLSAGERVRVALGRHLETIPPHERASWILQVFAGEPYASGAFIRIVNDTLCPAGIPVQTSEDLEFRARECGYGTP